MKSANHFASLAFLLVLTCSSIGAPALAQSAVCHPPRCSTHALTFEGVEFQFNVLLPASYAASVDRYPVLYLLHGALGDKDAWLKSTNLEEFTADKPVIVVMPSFAPFGLVFDYGNVKTETFFTQVLIPYVDSSYATRAGHAYRAIAGLSAGGSGAMQAAARHPDLFMAAGGFSGAIYDFGGDGREVLYQSFVLGAQNAPCKLAGQGFLGPCFGYDGQDLFAPLGDPATSGLVAAAHSPTALASNLGGVSVYLASGNGVPCDQRDLESVLNRLAAGDPTKALEPNTYRESLQLDGALSAAEVPHTADFYGCGIHDWPYWERDLATFWDQMTAAFGTAAPSAFDFRSADGVFSIYDWTFAADPARAPEFLDVNDASCSGLTLTGSGTTMVTTAPCFAPSKVVALGGAVEPSATADGAGRITFTVDLGLAHTVQQYTLPQKLIAAQGNDFTSRAVTLDGTP